MKSEYDFSKAERGKFFRENLLLDMPIHLDPEVLEWVAARATTKGTDISQIVNELLKRDIDLIESVK